jgi:hypothetical protein
MNVNPSAESHAKEGLKADCGRDPLYCSPVTLNGTPKATFAHFRSCWRHSTTQMKMCVSLPSRFLNGRLRVTNKPAETTAVPAGNTHPPNNLDPCCRACCRLPFALQSVADNCLFVVPRLRLA